MTDAHDWDGQYKETAWVWNDLQSKQIDFQHPHTLEIQFLPAGPSPDVPGFSEALEAAGYTVRHYRNNPTVEAAVASIRLTLETLWEHERRTTEIALRHGFSPDGWGFLEG